MARLPGGSLARDVRCNDKPGLPAGLTGSILAGRILILAPHMDDEILACGGAMLMHTQKANIHCLFATDGGGVYTDQGTDVTINRTSIQGNDAEPRIQVRLDLGILQMCVDGRPDGHRPNGFDSLLEYHDSRLDEIHAAQGSNVVLGDNGTVVVDGDGLGAVPGERGSGRLLLCPPELGAGGRADGRPADPHRSASHYQ